MTAPDALALADSLLVMATVGFAAAGWRAIRAGDRRRHRNRMLAAFACSAGFLAIFVVHFVRYGFHPAPAGRAGRVVYYVLLFAHEPIAVLSVPLVLVTLALGLRGSRLHAEIARPALAIWMIAAVTGLALYVALYLAPT